MSARERVAGRVSLVIWRREIAAEVDQMLETVAAIRPADPSEEDEPYWDAIRGDISFAAELADWRIPNWRRRWLHEVAVLWTGSEPEAARDALHRADEALFMVAPEAWIRAEARSITALKAPDASKGPYAELSKWLQGVDDTNSPDRETLRTLRHDDNSRRDNARHQILILRNILTCAAVLLTALLVGVAFWARTNPALLPLRPAPPHGSPWGRPADVAVVEVLGALGGLVSAIVALRNLSSYRRHYGLPLVQSLLKLPMGAAVGLIAVFLVQQRVVAALAPIPWGQVPAYALVFGFAQLAVTKAVDAKANSLAASLSAATRTATPPSDGAAGAATTS